MPSRAIWLISGSGLVPFLVCLALAWFVPSQRTAAVQLFIVYSALTLTFLGGARWGAELVRAPHDPKLSRMMLAAAPSVVGLMALLPRVRPPLAIGLLLASSVAQLLWDAQASRDGLLPPWNARVRTVMTLLGTGCTLAMWPMIR
jgi:hypothetical protein